jgi:hypothetical protein
MLPAVLGRTESKADRALTSDGNRVMSLSDDPIQKRGFSPGTSFRVIIYPTFGMIRQAQSHLLESTQRSSAFE